MQQYCHKFKSHGFEIPQKRVGACLVMHEPRRAISVGYNGYPDDCSEKDEGKGLYEFFCSECGENYKLQNAVLSLIQY